MMPGRTESLLTDRRFLLFFISQNAVACGAFVQVVAVARLLLQSTGSGLAAGFGIVCAPIPGILFSLAAGGIGDRFQSKTLLIVFDLLRGGFVFLFALCKTSPAIFCLMLAVSLLDVLYSPAKNKTLTSFLEKGDLIKGNSLLNGGYGAVSLVMPLLTGLLIGAGGSRIAFIPGGCFYLISALTLLGLDADGRKQAAGRREQRSNIREQRGDIREGLIYCLRTGELKRTILALAAFDFGTACVNIAFYALAFDKLHVTSGYWGLLLSVLYGMNIVAMLVLLRYKERFQLEPVQKAYALQLVVALVWIFYGFMRSPWYILLGAAAEGFCTALSSTLLLTRLLENTKKSYTARVMGIRDLCSNTAKIAGIGLTYLLMTYFDVRVVLIVGASAVLAFIIIQVMSLFSQKDNSRCSGT